MSRKGKKIIEYANIVKECVPYNVQAVGVDNSLLKTEEVIMKSQSVGVPWERGIYFNTDGAHHFIKIDGKIIDMSYDSKTKKMLPKLNDKDKIRHSIDDKYFSRRHTWSDIIFNMWDVIQKNNGRVLWSDSNKDGAFIMAVFSNGLTNEVKTGIIEEAEDYGLDASFKDSKKGYTKLILEKAKGGVDKSLRPSHNYALIDYDGNYRDKRLKPAKKNK